MLFNKGDEVSQVKGRQSILSPGIVALTSLLSICYSQAISGNVWDVDTL